MFTRRGLRELDRLAAEEFGLPTIVLMENAGRAVAEVVLDALGKAERPGVLAFIGPGSNGGDGLVAMRHLSNAEVEIKGVLAAAPEAYTGDAAVNLQVVQRMGLSVSHMGDAAGERPGVVIDALLGTGLSRPVEGFAAGLVQEIARLRQEGARVLSVDIPSGLDADTGGILGCAVQADVTVSLVGLKLGFAALGAQEYLGEVVVADIGVPRSLLARLSEGAPAAGPDRPSTDSVDEERFGRRERSTNGG